MEFKRELEQKVLMAARDNNISAQLFRIAIARRVGLNSTDWECLSLLSIRGVATPTELAHHTGLTTGATTAMLDRLEKAQYIRRTPNPDDRRGVRVEIDERWTQTAAPLVRGVQQAQAELIAGYTDAELATIADFLTRFTANVTAHTKWIEAGVD